MSSKWTETLVESASRSSEQNQKMAGIDQLRTPFVKLTLGGSGSSESYNGSLLTSYSATSESRSSGTSQSLHDSANFSHDYADIPGGDVNPYSCVHHRQCRDGADTTDDGNMSMVDDVGFAKLPEMARVPWSEQEVLNVLREGRTKHLCGHITVEMMQRLSFLLQRPLVRIAREIQRLSLTLNKCTKHEVHTAMKIVLCRKLSESSTQACHKALAVYAMSTHTHKQSKSERAALHFSIGKFHRWMVDMCLARYVHEFAAVFLTACVENLLEEIVLMSLGNEQLGDSVLSLEVLDYGIACSSALWGLLQPFEHLICGVNSSGTPSLPASLILCTSPGGDGRKVSIQHEESKNIEQCLLATCVGSLTELGDLVSQAVHHWYNKTTLGNGASPSNRRQHSLSWGREALHVLFYYMRCPDLEKMDNPHKVAPHDHLNMARLSTPLLMEWIRVATAHAEHRNSQVVDGNDVSQAARLLLPGIDCPHRLLEPGETCASRQLDAGQCVARFQQDMAFRMLSCGRSDTVPHALALLGTEGVNAKNDQGLTPLMYACTRGDEAMVHILLDAGAAVDLAVPTDTLKYPSIDAETKSWTALTFATVQGHIAIVQLLLERGAQVEGAHKVGGDNYSETPLQLASAAGHYELVCLLLTRGADPYLTTVPRNGVSFTYSFGGHSSFSLAAAHGHRKVIRRLLEHKVNKMEDVLSLEEMLAEGATDTFKNRYNVREKFNSSEQTDLDNEIGSDNGNTENIYVTIDDVISVDSTHQEEPPTSKLTRTQNRVLQESMYQAAENGFLDIALELKNLGVAWNSYTWGRCVESAYNMRRTSLLLNLLLDFSHCHLEADCGPSFVSQCLPLLFEILKRKKREPMSARMTDLLCHIYGKAVIPEIPPPIQRPPTRIDPRYVNNPELSDIQFMIEGHIFYAHKIILVNASNRFRAMLSSKFTESSQPVIEINDVRYQIFQYIMEYLYNGGTWTVHIDSHEQILDLLGAANFFLLDGLQHHCERLCAGKVTFDNCIHIYKQAKLFNAESLMSYCEGFFLQNMPALLQSNESFSKLLFSSKQQSYDLVNGLLATLGRRLTDRLHARNRKIKVAQL